MNLKTVFRYIATSGRAFTFPAATQWEAETFARRMIREGVFPEGGTVKLLA